MVLPGLCARLGFVIPEAAALQGHGVLAGAEAYLNRMERDAEARLSELSPENPAEDQDDAEPSF